MKKTILANKYYFLFKARLDRDSPSRALNASRGLGGAESAQRKLLEARVERASLPVNLRVKLYSGSLQNVRGKSA